MTIKQMQMANQLSDTSAMVARRINARDAAGKAIADRERRFPDLTAENAAEAIAYQEERLRFHLEE